VRRVRPFGAASAGRGLGLWWLAALAACDCDYHAHAPGQDASPLDGGTDAAEGGDDAGREDGPWLLQQGQVELRDLDCSVAEGQRVFVRVTVMAPKLCHEPGPVEVRLTGVDRELQIVGWYWAPVHDVCSDLSVREDRWLDLGVLEQGSWTLRSSEWRDDVTIEVGPPSGGACAERPAERGGPCQKDCDCASERCVPDLDGAACERRCGDLPCGDGPDCLQGRCESEMPERYRQGFLECLPTYGPCAVDADCPPAQRCEGTECVFREFPDAFVPCTRGADCAAGWPCVVDEFDLEHGECAVRCFTDHTPCPIGECMSSPGFGPAWTCSFLAD